MQSGLIACSFEFNDIKNDSVLISFVMTLYDEDAVVAMLAHELNVVSDALERMHDVTMTDDKSESESLLISSVGVTLPVVLMSLVSQEHGILTFKKNIMLYI